MCVVLPCLVLPEGCGELHCECLIPVILYDLVLAIGPKVGGLNPAEEDGFLKAIKVRSTSCFERGK
jgi:hypothetical protein